jgi:predicted nucleic acid-binding protein
LPADSGQRQSSDTMADVDFLTDTDVLIEFLRGSAKAADWLKANQEQALGIPVLAFMEILQGARSRREQQMLVKVGILDCLIAATAIRIGKPFYTFNLKHFQVFPALDAREPYERL